MFMKISFICTVLNEEETIGELLSSVDKQTRKPDEIIIVDGGSTDATASKISNFQFPVSNKVKLIKKPGNRSVGRNEAIRNAKGDIIVISDAGCVLDKNWVKNITEPFKNQNIDVVAGYYKGVSKNTFEKCVIPYFLVMPDKVNPNTFLPATRSMAIKKKVFEKVGYFNENLSLNEDYEFAKRLKKNNVHIVFQKDAIVYWQPPSSLSSFFKTIYRFARGDIQAKILRPKVIVLLSRYILLFQLLVMFFATGELIILAFLFIMLMWYALFAIKKNFKYSKSFSSLFIFPLLQFVSDFAVIGGTIRGAKDLWDTPKK